MIEGRPQEAAAHWRRIGCPYEEADALLGSDQPAALGHAVMVFRRLGAQPAAERAAARLRELGASVPRGAAATTVANPLGLTDRELEVLRLVAAGRSNPEIAHELVISRKTAAHHVSRILTKVGARTRGEAAAAAYRAGLT